MVGTNNCGASNSILQTRPNPENPRRLQYMVKVDKHDKKFGREKDQRTAGKRKLDRETYDSIQNNMAGCQMIGDRAVFGGAGSRAGRSGGTR